MRAVFERNHDDLVQFSEADSSTSFVRVKMVGVRRKSTLGSARAELLIMRGNGSPLEPVPVPSDFSSTLVRGIWRMVERLATSPAQP